MARQRTAERGFLETVRAVRQNTRTGQPRPELRLALHAELRSLLLHGDQMVLGRRRTQLLQPVRLALRGVRQLHERAERLRNPDRAEAGSLPQRTKRSGLISAHHPAAVFERHPSGRRPYAFSRKGIPGYGAFEKRDSGTTPPQTGLFRSPAIRRRPCFERVVLSGPCGNDPVKEDARPRRPPYDKRQTANDDRSPYPETVRSAAPGRWMRTNPLRPHTPFACAG